MSLTCITCGGSMPDDADFCPSCGRAVARERVPEPQPAPAADRQDAIPLEPVRPRPVQPVPREEPLTFEEEEVPSGPPATLHDRLLAAAAYFTFLPALAFLFMKQFQGRAFVRFHALQSISYWIAAAVLVGLGLLASTFGFLLLWIVAGILVALALVLMWLVLSIKALQGEWFRLPWVGGWAAQHSALVA